MSSILSLDQGTTGCHALVLHQDGRVLGSAYRPVTQFFPEPGWVEHDAEEIFRLTVEAGREAIRRAGEMPVGIGITNQRETVVLWDRRTLAPVARAIVWQDRRTAARCAELKRNGFEEQLRRRTGLVADPYFSATKLEWLLDVAGHRSRAEAGMFAAGTIDAWLIAKLTGGRVHMTDHTNASRTLLYDLASRDWCDELLECFGVPRQLLPEIVASSGAIGDADPSYFGSPIPIAGIAGDQQASLFGLGCVRAGEAKNTYGTGAFLLVHQGDMRPEPETGVLATAACGPRGEPAYALEGSILVAGAAIQWLRDQLGVISTAEESEMLARSVPDTGGVHFVPAFAGLATPHWAPDVRGTITGLTRGTTRAHIVRAALEAMGFGVAELYAALRGSSALKVDGGASANDWLMQFQADILGVPVRRPDVVETTALGAAGLAGIALGLWRDADEFVANRTFTTFSPAMEAGDRHDLLAGWHQAVAGALAAAATPTG
ncbi:MAG TPA: glycerol kinase [Gemmatimonadales bacterium]|jgi:glycerol kinase|nr:glycerol kinase [Gemmatimonadales bacterium]